MHGTTVLRWWDFKNTVEIIGSGIQITADSCLRTLYYKWTRIRAVEGMDPIYVLPHLSTLGSFLWITSVWIWLAVWKPGATHFWLAGRPRCTCRLGNSSLSCCQTAWRAVEFSLMKLSVNGIFTLCSDVDFHKALWSWYLWNISCKLIRISLRV